jgi:small multidrug resistance pump
MLANVFPNTSPWLFLSLAIGFELCGTTAMKMSAGFKNLTPSILLFVFYACAFLCNTLALRKLDLSVTYAIWCGVGTALTAIVGFVYFKEAITTQRVVSLGLIVAGVIGLRFSVTDV